MIGLVSRRRTLRVLKKLPIQPPPSMCVPMCAQLGDLWKPPGSWNSIGLIRSVLSDALTYEQDALGAISQIMALWEGDAATQSEQFVSEIRKYIRLVKDEKLAGPHRTTKGRVVARNIFAAVPVARLLISEKDVLRAALEEHYVAGRERSPTKAALREMLSSCEDELGHTISELQTEVVRADDAKRQAAIRARNAASKWKERCKLNTQQARSSVQQARSSVKATQEQLKKDLATTKKANQEQLKKDLATAKKAAMEHAEAELHDELERMRRLIKE